MTHYSKDIAQKLNLSASNVEATLTLLDEGCTIPFIARYRKERTGHLNDIQIVQISEWQQRLEELAKRKSTIIKTIQSQGKLSDDLQKQIEDCIDASTLEDLYLPYKPKRRTKAEIAREQGYEPIAILIMAQRDRNPEPAIMRLLKGQNEKWDEAIAGAKAIIAEKVSEDATSRNIVRSLFKREAMITSKVVKKKEKEPEAQKFADYFDVCEPLKRCSSHRLLAMRRGESAGILRVSISIDSDEATTKLKRRFVHGIGTCQTYISEAIDDAFKRLINPSIENEFASISKEKADEEAIHVFAENLKQLLLAAPLGQKRTLAIDPGFANGCKTACLSAEGQLLHHEIIYPTPPRNLIAQASQALLRMIGQFQIEAIAIGNGTASRETYQFVENTLRSLQSTTTNNKQIASPTIYVVSEDGASVYSASETAREEFPDEDVTTRGAVSIGRRLMDPLAELVKIDPKSIGVGQYQHDVDQSKLKQALDMTTESCVNQVGVNLNTASIHLLTYVSGLGKALAKNIVDYRNANGPFTSRAQLKKIPRLGNIAYQQCAGFLRIPQATNPLDNTAVHPESYAIVEQMAKNAGCSISELISSKEKQQAIDITRYVTNTVGLPTLKDIMEELDKPGRDPRQQLETFKFADDIHEIEDLQVGMILPGIVTNITNFGAFVDIGVHQDGLVHISQLANKFVSDPTTIVSLHQHVSVKVTDIDYKRSRISLSMKQAKQ